MNNDDLYLEQILVGPMDNFVYLIGSKSTREVALIDPAWDIDALLETCSKKRLKTLIGLNYALSSRSLWWWYGRTFNRRYC